jgi:hypothetical protein
MFTRFIKQAGAIRCSLACPCYHDIIKESVKLPLSEKELMNFEKNILHKVHKQRKCKNYKKYYTES